MSIRALVISGCVVFLCLVTPEAIEAQYRAPAVFHTSTQNFGSLIPPRATSERPSRMPYILAGAVVGGVVAGVLAYQDVKNSDAILGEVGVAIAAAAGAAAGAVIGWVVYAIRH